MNPIITIIVPIYNTEKFLDKCIQSIRKQTLKEIEIICVDDCSPDNSAAIVEKHSAKDPRIVLIRHEKNLGLGGARNTAIRQAKADFIASVDSDDYIAPHMMETLWNASEKGKFDIVCCGFDKVDEKGKKLETQSSRTRDIINEKNSINIFSVTNPAFWNKLWRKSLYTEHDIFFPNYVFYQDKATTPRILSKAKKIKIIEDSLYFYLIRSDSATYTYSPKHIMDYFKVFEVLIDFLKENDLYKHYEEEFLAYVDRGIRFHTQNVMASGMKSEELDQYLRLLLVFKVSFLQLYHYIDSKDQNELTHLLESAQSRGDLLPRDGKERLEVSLVVKTFLRPVMLERFLLSVGLYEEEQNLKFAEIIVGDDSPPEIITANKRAIQKAKDRYPFLQIKHHEYEENIGLSDGRNRMVATAQYDYIFLCDDDFILDEDSDIRTALQYIIDDDFDLVGGWLKNQYNLKTGESVYWGSYGKIRETDDELLIFLNESEANATEIEPSDYLLNFFVAKKELLSNNPWNVELKVEEHQDFFLRLYRSTYRAAFCKAFFAKHTADRAANPKKYNKYRFEKSNWERYLYKSVQIMGKKRRIMNRWNDTQFVSWQVDAVKRTNIQKSFPLREKILAQRVNVKRLTPPYQNYFFGYYDVQSVSDDHQHMICQTAPVIDVLPTEKDWAEITLINTKTLTTKVIAETSAWCHQQGAHLQYVPKTKDTIIYNLFDPQEKKFKARTINLNNKKEKTYEYPVSAISPTGAEFASLNFARLYDYRPGYGYSHQEDPFKDDFAPKEDGIFIQNIQTGKTTLILSYENIREAVIEWGFSEYAEQKFIVNHVAFNTDGSKLLILARTFSGDAPFPTFTLVCNNDGSHLKHVFGFCSHYHWKDNDTFVASGSPHITRKEAREIKVYEVNSETLEYDVLAEGVLTDDGHCSYSPDRSLLLYDSYSNTKFPYRCLQVYSFEDDSAIDLGYFFSEGKLFANNTDLRCDLHPRWSKDGTSITFDSTHEGFRGVYSIQVDEIRAAFKSQIEYLNKQDLMKWYQIKYNLSKINTPVDQQNNKPLILTDQQKKKVNTLATLASPFLNKRKIKKLKNKPEAFFKDSKSTPMRLIGVLLKLI